MRSVYCTTMHLLVVCCSAALLVGCERKADAAHPTTAPTSASAPAKVVADWPQWAGPDANYTSPEKDLLREWPKGGPQVLWHSPIGQGWSSPSVAGNEVYVHSGHPSSKWEVPDKESVVCLDAITGRELWSYAYDIGHGATHLSSKNVAWYWGGPRGTPTITEKYVYTLGLHGHLACIDRKTHKPVWERELANTYWPGPYPEWKGVNFSPVVADGVVLIPFGYGKNRCSALDAETGKLKWVYPADTDLTSFKGCNPGCTPVLATFGKDRCAVIGGDTWTSFRALRLSDGKQIWQFEWTIPGSTDRSMGNSYLLNGQIVDQPGIYLSLINVDFRTPPFTAKAAYIKLINNKGANPVHPLVPSGDYLYGFLETASDTGKFMDTWSLKLMCVDRKTGEVVWKQEGFKVGNSIITADGLLFTRSFQSLYLVEATPTGYVEKGKVEKLYDVTNKRGEDGGWVMPVLSHGKLFIRTPSELICFKVSKE